MSGGGEEGRRWVEKAIVHRLFPLEIRTCCLEYGRWTAADEGQGEFSLFIIKKYMN